MTMAINMDIIFAEVKRGWVDIGGEYSTVWANRLGLIWQEGEGGIVFAGVIEFG